MHSWWPSAAPLVPLGVEHAMEMIRRRAAAAAAAAAEWTKP